MTESLSRVLGQPRLTWLGVHSARPFFVATHSRPLTPGVLAALLARFAKAQEFLPKNRSSCSAGKPELGSEDTRFAHGLPAHTEKDFL